MFGFGDKTKMIDAETALPGRAAEIPIAARHAVLGTPMKPPFPDGLQQLVVGMGCFWGAEKDFWQLPGVYTTAVGYAGGFTPNPTYEEVCSGSTGHAEVVLVVFDPEKLPLEDVLKTFWEGHDPTQGMRQGNDRGTQYRSAIYYTSEPQREAAERTKAAYQQKLSAAGYGAITTEIAPSCLGPARHPASPDRAPHESSCCPFYYAEDYHQQYLHKNPWGYCPDHGTGVSCPVGLRVPASAAEQPS
jgi:peptide-methionine (S)-S-oxide reductase